MVFLNCLSLLVFTFQNKIKPKQQRPNLTWINGILYEVQTGKKLAHRLVGVGGVKSLLIYFVLNALLICSKIIKKIVEKTDFVMK